MQQQREVAASSSSGSSGGSSARGRVPKRKARVGVGKGTRVVVLRDGTACSQTQTGGACHREAAAHALTEELWGAVVPSPRTAKKNKTAYPAGFTGTGTGKTG